MAFNWNSYNSVVYIFIQDNKKVLTLVINTCAYNMGVKRLYCKQACL